MTFKKFTEALTREVRNIIHEEMDDAISISLNKVVKTNDEVLHGITLKMLDKNCMPTFYFEDFYEAYEEGDDIKEMAKAIVGISCEAYLNVPDFATFSLEFENVRDHLLVQLLDADLNEERLKQMVYKPVGNGFVMVAYIAIKSSSEGYMRTAVTKDMAESYGYDEDEVMDTAFSNTIARFEPIFASLIGFNKKGVISPEDNLLDKNLKINADPQLYILTNSSFNDGACTFFYPFVAERIGEILGDNYYVLPSSLHEVIIVPANMNLEVKTMQRMVSDANSTVVDKRDILSEKVLFYNREKNILRVQNAEYSQ